jgi:beta-glucosidase
VDAVKSNLITEPEIDRSLQRLFIARFKLGMFDPPERVPFSKIPYSENDSPAHRQVALEAARKSIVLLKNDNQTLPLKPSVKKIAVIGPSADDPDALLGNYNGFSSHHVSPLEGIERQFSKQEIRFALGSTYTEKFHSLVPSNVLTAPNANRGLLAEYFDNADLQGSPKFQRVEPRPNLPAIPDPAVAAAGVPQRAYSVRWTGTLKAPLTGDYLLGVRGAGVMGRVLMHVFLDDKEVLGDVAAAGMARVREAHAQLEAGHSYVLRIEYKQPGNAVAAALVWVPPAEALLTEAVDAVKNADVTLAFVGLNSSLEGEEMNITVPGFLGGDRTDLNLPGQQERLLEAAIATGKPVVVILTSGSALAVNFAAARAAAILEAWYGGEEIGTAIGETLAGDNNPAGRLPVTFYKSIDQLPPFDDYFMKGKTYRYFSGDPLYSFGFGLSYSKFQYSRLRAERTSEGAHVSVTVKNDSSRAGDEVVQLYVDGAGANDDPIRQLRGFQRIHLPPGESGDVEFLLGPDDLPKTKVAISVGSGQPLPGIPHVQATF